MKTIKRTSVSKTQDELVHTALKSHFGYAKQTSEEGVFQVPNGAVCVSEEQTENSSVKIVLNSNEGESILFVDEVR